MRRRGIVLVLLFLIMPLIELAILIRIGQTIGVGWTLLLLIAAAVLGSWLVRREGRRAWQALTDALSSGRMPQSELADGALVLFGGTLLLTPGFVTDLVGMFCVLPLTRPVARRALARAIGARLMRDVQARKTPPTVVEGEVLNQDRTNPFGP